MKLYEYTMLIDSGFDPETGEIFDESKLEELQLARTEKLEAVACYYKDLKNFKEDIKREIDRLQAELKRCDKKADWVERYIAANMSTDEKVKTVKCQIGFRKSESVIIEDLDLVPEQFVVKKTTMQADKTMIKEAIKNGAEISGAFIQTNYNLSIK